MCLRYYTLYPNYCSFGIKFTWCGIAMAFVTFCGLDLSLLNLAYCGLVFLILACIALLLPCILECLHLFLLLACDDVSATLFQVVSGIQK